MKPQNDEEFTDLEDVEFLDLDKKTPLPPDIDVGEEDIVDEDYEEIPKRPKPRRKVSSSAHRPHGKKKKKRMPELHVILLIVILAILAIAVIRLMIWNKGTKVQVDTSADTSEFDTEANDHIIPLNADDPNYVAPNADDELHILLLGNDVLTDGEDQGEGFADLIRQKTGATAIYNAAIPGSYVTCAQEEYSSSFRMDGLNLPTIAKYLNTGDDSVIRQASEDLGELFTDRMRASLEELKKIDKDKLDTICIFYDSRDFLGQRPPGDTSATDDVSITNYFGALNASLQMLQSAYPDARIIIMSPHFAHFVDESGNSYSSADESAKLGAPQFIYVNRQYFSALGNRVSFVDNFYGTIYEDIADKYLEDNIHLNTEGRKLLADRYLAALNRFGTYEFKPE